MRERKKGDSEWGLRRVPWRLPLNRPMVWVGAGFVGGMCAAAVGVCPGVPLPAVLCAGALVAGGLAPSRISMRVACIVLVSFGLGALLWNVRHVGPIGDPLSWHVAEHPGEYAVEGRVRLSELEEANPDRYQFVIDADQLVVNDMTYPLCGGVVVRWNQPGSPVYADDRVRVTGTMSVSLAGINPGVNSYEDYLRLRGVHTAIQARGPDSVATVAKARWYSPRYWASRLRVSQAERLRAAIPEGTLPFVQACWLGFNQTVSAEEYQWYIQSGTAHILSVSGIHTAMVFVTVSFVLKMLVRNRRGRAALVMSAVMLYVMMSGVRLSGLRAALMVVVYMAAELVDRDPDAPTALSLSAVLMLAWQPDALFDTGFQLSFLSMASILLFAEPLNNVLMVVPRQIRGPVATSLGVQVLPTPVAVSVFHVFPLGAVFANLIVVPLCTAALWLCFLTSLATLVSSHVALLFGHAIMPVVEAIRFVAKTVAAPEFSHLTVISPTFAAMCAYWGAIGCVVAAVMGRRRRLWTVCAVVLAAGTVLLWRPMTYTPEIVFLDVGHGDATFVRTPEGKTMLVDGGDTNKYRDAGKRLVAPFLWSNHVRRLDYVAVSHPDSDHIGGLFYILDHFRVGEVLMGGAQSKEKKETAFIEKCRERGVPVRQMWAGDKLDVGGMSVEALHPPENWPDAAEVNDKSLMLRLTLCGVTTLLTGDVATAGEKAMVQTPALCQADILKVPHHGSGRSSSEAFVAAVQPKYCVVSTGGNYGKEHVDTVVLNRYKRHGVCVWRTDYEGGVAVTFGQDGPVIEGTRERLGYPHMK